MNTTLATSSGTIALRGDIPWADEFGWTPVSQAISTTLGGALIIEVGVQTFGRPITLGGNRTAAWVDGDTMDALQAAEIAQLDTPFTLTLADGRTFSVLFNGSLGSPAVTGELLAVENADGSLVGNVTPTTTAERSAARYFITVRLIQVG